MSCETREKLIQLISELCERYPNWRFGQLVSNVAGWADVEIWDVDDDDLISAASAHLEQLTERVDA